MKSSDQKLHYSGGYALTDVLLAVFLFTLGFTVLYGLTEGAYQETQRAANLTEAANLAQAKLDQLAAHEWQENIAAGKCIPGSSVEGKDGKYSWAVNAQWEVLPNLLKVRVTVQWQENGGPRSYSLESVFYAN